MHTALHASGFSTSYVVQDLAALPYSIVDSLIEYTQAYFNIFPLWLWGFGPSNRESFIKLTQDLEVKLQELGGMKWLYANTYYPEIGFWNIYDRKLYDALRAKYHATSLPSVWHKVHTDVDAEVEAVKSSWWLRFLTL